MCQLLWEFMFSFVLPSCTPHSIIHNIISSLVWTRLLFSGFSNTIKMNSPVCRLRKHTPRLACWLSPHMAQYCLSGAVFIGDLNGVYAAFGQNLLMSILFVIMHFKREMGWEVGQFFISVFRLLGTGLTNVHFCLYEPVSRSSFALPLLIASIFLLDLLYFIIISSTHKKPQVLLQAWTSVIFEVLFWKQLGKVLVQLFAANLLQIRSTSFLIIIGYVKLILWDCRDKCLRCL